MPSIDIDLANVPIRTSPPRLGTEVLIIDEPHGLPHACLSKLPDGTIEARCEDDVVPAYGIADGLFKLRILRSGQPGVLAVI